MEFKAPDIKGPRFRPCSKKVIDKEFTDKFEKRFPEHGEIKPDKFRDIIMHLHTHVVNGIVEHRDGIELPEGLGFIFIATCQKSKKENIDFNASSLAGKKILHQNWESDNRLMKIIFSNTATKYRLPNKQIWGFRMAKQNRKLISNKYKQQWAKYHVIPNMKGIHTMFKTRMKTMAIKQNTDQQALADYDEFKMD